MAAWKRSQNQALQRQIAEQKEMHAARMADQQKQYYGLLQQARSTLPCLSPLLLSRKFSFPRSALLARCE